MSIAKILFWGTFSVILIMSGYEIHNKCMKYICNMPTTICSLTPLLFIFGMIALFFMLNVER